MLGEKDYYIDFVTGKVNGKELNKRLSNGYYAKKKLKGRNKL